MPVIHAYDMVLKYTHATFYYVFLIDTDDVIINSKDLSVWYNVPFHV